MRMTMKHPISGVEFDVIAREWRMKWSPENDKQSLANAQAALSSVIASVRNVTEMKPSIHTPSAKFSYSDSSNRAHTVFASSRRTLECLILIALLTGKGGRRRSERSTCSLRWLP